jgi:hypothetical protein
MAATNVQRFSGDVILSGNMNLQKVSNTATIKLDSNVVTEFNRSKKLIKYPRVALTANSSGGYVAGRSTNYVNSAATEAWKMFDEDASTYWHSANSTGYWNTDGTYDGSSELITGHLGEYVTLQLPTNEKVQLKGIRVFPRGLRGQNSSWSAGAAPKDVVVIGSNGGSSWDVIATTTLTNYSFGASPSTSTPVGEEFVPATFDFETTEYYQYVGLIIKSLYSGNHEHASISTLEFLGVPEYDPDAHGTDVVVKSYPNVPNTDWLEVYYDAKDYTSGVVQDLSTNSFNGTLTNGASFNNSDGIDKFVFDAGLNQYMTTTTDISGVDFTHTTSMWVKFVEVSTDSNDQHYLFMLGTFGSNSIGMYYSANHGMRVAPTGFDYRTQYHPVAGKWFHVSYTYAGGAHGTAAMNTTVKFYINGKQWNIPAYHGNTTTVTLPSSSVLQINGSAGNNNTLMDMEVANFRLFNRALTIDEIYQLYAYQKEDFGHGDLSMTLKAGRLGIGTSEPKAMLDVRGVIKGGRTTFLTWDYLGQRYVDIAAIANATSYANVANVLDHTFDIPSCYHGLGTANLKAFVQIDWRGEVHWPWNFGFRIEVTYNGTQIAYSSSSDHAASWNSRVCGVVSDSYHNDYYSTPDYASVTSLFTLNNCDVSSGSTLKVQLLGQHGDTAGSNRVWTGRTNGNANQADYELPITSFLVILDVDDGY